MLLLFWTTLTKDRESIPVVKSYPHPVCKLLNQRVVDIHGWKTVIFAPFRAGSGVYFVIIQKRSVP
jgi:hypothetical protein